ncbi:MAG: hypothetical protein ACOYNI_11315 [Acidimicrobiia bacterium]
MTTEQTIDTIITQLADDAVRMLGHIDDQFERRSATDPESYVANDRAVHTYVLGRLAALTKDDPTLSAISVDASTRARLLRFSPESEAPRFESNAAPRDGALVQQLEELVGAWMFTKRRAELAAESSIEFHGIASALTALDELPPELDDVDIYSAIGAVAMRTLPAHEAVHALRRIEQRYLADPGVDLSERVQGRVINLERLAIAEEALNRPGATNTVEHARSVAASNRAAALAVRLERHRERRAVAPRGLA